VIRSLRVRFFVVVWLIAVIALVGMGLYLGRWTRQEFRAVLVERGAPHGDFGALRAGERLGEYYASHHGWSEVAPLLVQLSGELSAAAGLPLQLVVASRTPDGGLEFVAASSDDIAPAELRFLPGDEVRYARQDRSGRTRQRVVIRAEPLDIPVEGAASPGVLYAFPLEGEAGLRFSEAAGRSAAAPRGAAALDADSGAALVEHLVTEDEDSVSGLVNAADRAILTAVLLASAFAVLATLLLARPVIGGVSRLALAARRIREGDLSVRVPVRSRDELGDLARSFNEMTATLERSEALKRRLMTDVSHELRTPLTNIVGLLEAIEDGLREPDAETLASLRQEAGLLDRLVEDLGELSQAEAGELRLDLEEVDVTAEARRAAEAFRPTTDVAIEIRRRPWREGQSPDGPLARVDRRRLGQVLRNLLQNAITHSPRGGKVVVEVKEVGGSWIQVVVEDEGPGIPPEHLDLVWERFYRVDPSRDRRSGGMGLGLAIVRRLVEAHEGRAWAESRPEGGASFHFTIRAAPP